MGGVWGRVSLPSCSPGLAVRSILRIQKPHYVVGTVEHQSKYPVGQWPWR
ncbi:hypothetical protein PpBr36_01360 [Pyricularia pennisetigena]|nr:hypothetical protein PpBr36_01360 [Pyricularia pennisetigena]TLS29460.1 hypothetical protein PpBr36_01360 [Pyricularia pennisetigena]